MQSCWWVRRWARRNRRTIMWCGRLWPGISVHGRPIVLDSRILPSLTGNVMDDVTGNVRGGLTGRGVGDVMRGLTGSITRHIMSDITGRRGTRGVMSRLTRRRSVGALRPCGRRRGRPRVRRWRRVCLPVAMFEQSTLHRLTKMRRQPPGHIIDPPLHILRIRQRNPHLLTHVPTGLIVNLPLPGLRVPPNLTTNPRHRIRIHHRTGVIELHRNRRMPLPIDQSAETLQLLSRLRRPPVIRHIVLSEFLIGQQRAQLLTANPDLALGIHRVMPSRIGMRQQRQRW